MINLKKRFVPLRVFDSAVNIFTSILDRHNLPILPRLYFKKLCIVINCALCIALTACADSGSGGPKFFGKVKAASAGWEP